LVKEITDSRSCFVEETVAVSVEEDSTVRDGLVAAEKLLPLRETVVCC